MGNWKASVNSIIRGAKNKARSDPGLLLSNQPTKRRSHFSEVGSNAVLDGDTTMKLPQSLYNDAF